MTKRKNTADRSSSMQEWAAATHFWGGIEDKTRFQITSRSACPKCGKTGAVTGQAPSPMPGKYLVAGRYIACDCGTPQERGVDATHAARRMFPDVAS
jgi:hypothetical protein